MIPDDFMRVLALLAAAFPQFTLKPATIEAYYGILSDLPTALLKAATLQIASEPSPFFPTAGQIRAAAFDLLEAQEARSAGEAWAEALAMIRDASKYYPGIAALKREDFRDPLAYDALQAVGGASVFLLPSEVEHTTRARFFDTYNILAQRRRTERRMLPQVREVAARLGAANAAKQLPAVSND